MFVKEIRNDLNFLDGFRGSLAIWVLIGHTCGYFNMSKSNPFDISGHYIGVNCFFILSSFLLTLRLSDELFSSNRCLNQMILIIIKYFVRRFFRIYIPFIIFVSLVKYKPHIFGGNFSYPSTWIEIVSLKYTSGNHLWTVAPEIKYYFLIPIICLFLLYVDKDNFFQKYLKISIFLVGFYSFISYTFKKDIFSKFHGVFLNGSILAIIFYRLKTDLQSKLILLKNSKIFGFITMIFYAKLVTLCSLPYNHNLAVLDKTNLPDNIGIYELTYKISLYWTFFLFLCLIGSPNFLTNVFELDILRSFGKYSFGVYLLHPMGIIFVKNYIKLEFSYESIFYVLFFSFLLSNLFFYLVENICVKIANHACKYISDLRIFK